MKITAGRKGRQSAFSDSDLEATRNALNSFAALQRKNCLSYEFVALKLGCSRDKASKLVVEFHRLATLAEK